MAWSNARITLQRAVKRHSIDEDIVVEGYETPGTRIAGRWTNPQSVTAAVTGSLQPASPESLDMLAEGSRTGSELELWCTTNAVPAIMKRAEGKPAAIVHWKGQHFKVVAVEDWWQHGRYWFALLSLVDQ